ncbi:MULTISPECIES: radical SAM protein [unclassified Kitasatospora]|uniref:radical SAM protein n=1 Tax=unclassified Kitasatospora TaxID=2633591 RepID=UPI0033F18ACD
MTITAIETDVRSRPPAPLDFAWLEVTGFCNEECDHCYADSGPQGTHGKMTADNWRSVLDQLAEMGTRNVQFIGGEPTLYPHLGDLIIYARGKGLAVEVFSNMTYITPALWDVLKSTGASLATSYYSDQADDHDTVTRHRGSHRKTRANIAKAVALGIPVRGGVITVNPGQRVDQAVTDLQSLGVVEIGGDRTRAFGRASRGVQPKVADLCGHCAHEKCAILPNGDVVPCVLGRFLPVGNVLEQPLSAIWSGDRLADALAEIGRECDTAQSCTPPQFLPMCGPCQPCVPSVGHCDPPGAVTA